MILTQFAVPILVLIFAVLTPTIYAQVQHAPIQPSSTDLGDPDNQAPLRTSQTQQCPQPPVLSCSSAAAITDTCCVLAPGGNLVHAQFWDLSVGQPNSWGVHGLWPDMCDGAFYENCDPTRAYSGTQIVDALQTAGAENTLRTMREFWLSNDDSPEEFWAHEWRTHGTCVSTLEPRCIEGYEAAQEVAPYFETVATLFQTLNTYDALARANIIPSDTNTYTLSALQDAVRDYTGYTPAFSCAGTALKSVEYYLRVEGPLQNGVFMQPALDSGVMTRRDLPRRGRGCPAQGIMYNVKDIDDQGDGSESLEGNGEDKSGKHRNGREGVSGSGMHGRDYHDHGEQSAGGRDEF